MIVGVVAFENSHQATRRHSLSLSLGGDNSRHATVCVGLLSMRAPLPSPSRRNAEQVSSIRLSPSTLVEGFRPGFSSSRRRPRTGTTARC